VRIGVVKARAEKAESREGRRPGNTESRRTQSREGRRPGRHKAGKHRVTESTEPGMHKAGKAESQETQSHGEHREKNRDGGGMLGSWRLLQRLAMDGFGCYRMR
jgi:hypothetical protein